MIEDKETGLMYYKARYYDPMVARFTQADSMVFNDQVSGMNRYMYVSGNPIKYIDPSGHRQTRGWLGGLIHDFNKWSRNLGHNYTHFTNRISKGKKGNYSNNTLSVGARKLGEAGTFARRFHTDSKYAFGVIEGVLDYGVSLIHNGLSGKPLPSISYHNGGFMVHNSYFADHNFLWHQGDGRSYVRGGVGHLKRGASKGTKKHEAGHIAQELQMGGGGIDTNFSRYINAVEYNNDLRSGTFNYGLSAYLFKSFLPPEVYEALYLANLYMDPANAYVGNLYAQGIEQNPNLLWFVILADSL